MASADAPIINVRKSIVAPSLLFPPCGLPFAAVIIVVMQGWQLWAVETTVYIRRLKS
jgi:hypothetical protein